MYSEITSAFLGHALLGAVLAILALATAFWLLLALRSASMAISKISALDEWRKADPAPQLKARAS